MSGLRQRAQTPIERSFHIRPEARPHRFSRRLRGKGVNSAPSSRLVAFWHSLLRPGSVFLLTEVAAGWGHQPLCLFGALVDWPANSPMPDGSGADFFIDRLALLDLSVAVVLGVAFRRPISCRMPLLDHCFFPGVSRE